MRRAVRPRHEGFSLIYLPLSLVLALLGFGFLLARGLRRVRSEPHKRATIAIVALSGLLVWLAATWCMLLIGFGTAWGLAHTRPMPPGPFPEGWAIYGAIVAYAALGVGLVIGLGKIPKKQAAV